MRADEAAAPAFLRTDRGRRCRDPRLRTMMSMRSDFLGHLQSDEALFKGAPADRRAAAARGGAARDRQPPGAASRRAFRDRRAHRHHHPAHGRGFDQGRRRAAAALLHARRHVGADGARKATVCCGCRRNRSSLAACWSSAPTSFWRTHPGAEDALRRILTLPARRQCARTASRRGAAPRAPSSPTRNGGWFRDLADYPNRLLVTVGTATAGETYAEVAHEAIFRRWDKLREWIAAEREFLIWRSGLEAARRAWQASTGSVRSAMRC